MPLLPYQVQNLQAEQTDGNILLSWNGVSGAVSYQIQRSLDGVNFVNLATTNANSYVDPYPGIGIKYYYQVAGYNLAPMFAFGTMTFTGQPNPGDTFSLANVVFTAVAAGAVGNQFNIGATVANTITNILNLINVVLVNVIEASAVGSVITFASSNNGPEGNGIQFSNALTNASIVQFSGGSNGSVGPYSSSAYNVAAPPSEMSLGELRLRAQQSADRVNSDFVTQTEWNYNIRLAMYELYDLLIGNYEDYKAQFVYIPTNGTQQMYALPDGATNYLGGTLGGLVGAPAQAFYKLMGLDLSVNTFQNAYVTVNRFNFIDRNQFVYPNSTSTIYGVNNMRYDIVDNNLMLIPVPAGNQVLKLWYNPRLPALLQDTDLTSIGVSGWLRYVIVRAAKYALDKEEQDTSRQDAELLFLKTRIEQMSANRDVGQSQTISNTRKDSIYGGSGWNGSNGGF